MVDQYALHSSSKRRRPEIVDRVLPEVVGIRMTALRFGVGGGASVSSGDPAQTLCGPSEGTRFWIGEGTGAARNSKTKIVSARRTIVRWVVRVERRLMVAAPSLQEGQKGSDP